MGAWWRRAAVVSAVLGLVACGGGGGEGAASSATGAEPAASGVGGSHEAASDLASLALRSPTLRSKLDRRLLKAKGNVAVWVTLDEAPVATLKADRLQAQGISMPARDLAPQDAERAAAASLAMRGDLLAHRQALIARQTDLASQMQSVGAKELGRVQLAANAMAVQVDARHLATIAGMSGVAKIRPVVDVQREPQPRHKKGGGGASPAEPGSFTGRGVRIAVLDSGVDYTHYNLGGAGTPEAYQQAMADPTRRDRAFPTAKVVAGYDFVGELWPFDELAPDSDPIDTEGHGTHVADIAAGRSADGKHKGVAPDASIVAVKVCSAVATSCSGVAILQGLDFALDPNGDGDISDAVDVVNMSLGSSYGQQEDDSATAVARMERLGVVVVVAAGNDGNRPYIVSSASTSPGAISVAQTSMPDDVAIPAIVNAPASLRGSYLNTETLDWAPVDRTVTGDVVYGGLGCADGSEVPASARGRVVLFDRGSCNVSEKVQIGGNAGAVAVLIGMVTDGETVSFSVGEGQAGLSLVPTLVIAKDLSDAMKAAIAAGTRVNMTMSPAQAVSVAGSMMSSSARGPSYSDQAIKPEIGAPGATISAVVGTGSENAGFGGTSGATPVVAGSAALLVQAHPTLRPEQIKALLMNSAERAVYHHKAKRPGVLAPITRIGAGEVRVERALALGSIAYVPAARSSALSFGFVDASRDQSFKKTVVVENLTSTAKTYAIKSSLRYASDATGAVTVSAPSQVTVPARGQREVDVTLRIVASKLPAWTLNGGALGGTGDLLDGVEFDGYLTFTAGAETLSMPWHVLPRLSADLGVSGRSARQGDVFSLSNVGAGSGGYEVFALTGSNPNDGEEPLPGSNIALVDLRAVGARLVAPGILQFAINTYGRRSHPSYPAEFDIYLDLDRDGIDDAVLFNAEADGFGASGQTVIYLYDFRTDEVSAYYYADADLNSGNIIFTVPTAALGIADNTSFDFSVYAFDNYFSGALTDFIGPMRFNPARPKWATSGAPTSGTVAPAGSVQWRSAAQGGGATASPSQQGFLLMYRRDRDYEADVVRITR